FERLHRLLSIRRHGRTLVHLLPLQRLLPDAGAHRRLAVLAVRDQRRAIQFQSADRRTTGRVLCRPAELLVRTQITSITEREVGGSAAARLRLPRFYASEHRQAGHNEHASIVRRLIPNTLTYPVPSSTHQGDG